MRKTYKTAIACAVLAIMATGCATTVPTAAAPLQVAPEKAAAHIPAWFVSPPQSSSENIFVVGTAVSRDMAMSIQKASLDAETHLASKIAGQVSSMTKDYKREVGDVFTQSTEIVTNKLTAEVKIIGGVIDKKQITPEGGGFRTYVLIRYPIAMNKMLQNYEAQRVTPKTNQEKAEAEMEKRIEAQKVKEGAQVQPVVETMGGVVLKITPADVSEEN